jgi:hypothetical protein
MTEASEQQTLDLGEYRGKQITDTAVKILNQTGGFHPETEMAEPRIFEMDEEFTIAARVVVTDHNIKRILSRKDDDPDRLQLLQTWLMGTIAVIPDTGNVKKELDKVAAANARREAAAEEAKAAKRGKSVRRGHLRSVGSSIEEALQGATPEGVVDTDPAGVGRPAPDGVDTEVSE